MILSALALLIVALIGGLAMEILGDLAMRNLSVILAFGGAFIMGLLFLHLVPEAFSFSSVAGIFVLLGFVVQILLEYLSKGLEHGHVHFNDSSNSKISVVLPWAAIASLCIHAFLESMPLAEGASIEDVSHQVRSMGNMHMHVHVDANTAIDSPLFMGLALHKLPVALVLMGLIKSTGATKVTRWSLLTLFGIMPGLGMYIYDAIIHSSVSMPGGVSTFMSATHGLVIGILLHVSTTVIFESGEGHAFHYKKLTATLLGLGIAFLTIG